jgi:hypothetical protein
MPVVDHPDKNPTTRKPKRSLICEWCNMRPVMDRCTVCEECWYADENLTRRLRHQIRDAWDVRSIYE